MNNGSNVSSIADEPRERKDSRCSHCHRIGPDVETTLDYVGGRGYDAFTMCADVVSCWETWASRHAGGRRCEGC